MLIIWFSETPGPFVWQGASFFLQRGWTLSSCPAAKKADTAVQTEYISVSISTRRFHPEKSTGMRAAAYFAMRNFPLQPRAEKAKHTRMDDGGKHLLLAIIRRNHYISQGIRTFLAKPDCL